MNLENDLKRALRPESPPPGLASRVMANIERNGAAGSQPAGGLRVHRSTWWRAAAASVTLAAVLGGYTVHHVRTVREGERAKEQVLQAMKIAGEKVRYAQQEVRGIGSND
jgi:hypothetical protein